MATRLGESKQSLWSRLKRLAFTDVNAIIRGLNAAEILSHLRVAYHITGAPRYHQAYEYLIQVHGYDENVRLAHDYMKKVTEIYARYLYLYEGRDYRQPLAVDADYVKDDLVY